MSSIVSRIGFLMLLITMGWSLLYTPEDEIVEQSKIVECVNE